MARSIRNALAHDQPVNRATLARYLAIIRQDPPKNPTSEPLRRVSSQSADQGAFRIHAWRDPEIERTMIGHGFVSVGGEELGDLTGVDLEEIRRRMTISMPDRTKRAISIFVGYWRRFLFDAALGDLVVLPLRSLEVAVGEFVSDYFYVEGASPHARPRREVSWLATDLSRDQFDADLLKTLKGRHTIQDFKASDAASRLRSLVDG